ncbi:MAG: DinB family protein [Anaerolineales bacterium]|jgi:hypothetical protein
MQNVLPWARAVLLTTPDRWINLTEMFPMELLTRQPLPNEWSALECLQHLVDTERSVFAARVKYLLAGQDFPAFDPDSQGTKPQTSHPPAELAREFARLRSKSLKLLEQVKSTDLDRSARHQELGIVTLGQMVHEWAAHDLMHTVQAERALMQPFIDGSGPWQSYFSDHWVRDK